MTSTACQFQVIELRSEEEIAACGSGQIARSLLLDPSILDPSESAALDAWLDLLDVGPLTLCLVDSACCAPPQTHAAKEELTKQTMAAAAARNRRRRGRRRHVLPRARSRRC